MSGILLKSKKNKNKNPKRVCAHVEPAATEEDLLDFFIIILSFLIKS